MSKPREQALPAISAPVGHFDVGAVNRRSDVVVVQNLLIAAADHEAKAAFHPGSNDGRIVRPSGRSITVAAIRAFQRHFLGYNTGLVEAASPTWKHLSQYSHLLVTSSTEVAGPAFMEIDDSCVALDLSGRGLLDLAEHLLGDCDATSVDLSDNPLKELPEALIRLESLRELRVNRAQLTALPEWLGRLQNLEVLSASDNDISVLPASIFALRNLRTLGLARNRLATLPALIAKMESLEFLELRGNGFDTFPPMPLRARRLRLLDLGETGLSHFPSSVCELSGLRALHLDNNQISSVPNAVGSLSQLRKLHLDGNRLSTLPTELGSLKHLRELYLSANDFRDLPDAVYKLLDLRTLDVASNRMAQLGNEIGNLTQLETIYLQDNTLEELPDEIGCLARLATLYIDGNQIAVLPDNIDRLSELRVLSWEGNPLRFPPPEILEQGAAAITGFFQGLREGGRPEWRSKVVLVGEGAVGKTSLKRNLAGEPFDPLQPVTHGIEISTLPFAHPADSEISMDLSIWDFGGQQIYHATHQFFLSRRSLFVLVWNARMGYLQSKLFYWLDMIEAKAPNSPILLVATHGDNTAPDLPFGDVSSRYRQIRSTFTISNVTMEGIEEVRCAIAEEAAKLPLMGERWPTKWLVAASAINSLPGKHSTIEEITATVSKQTLKAHEIRVLMRWLHELGDILFFYDSAQLQSRVVLDPQWVNQQICCVLEDKVVQGNHGIFRHEDAERIWDGADSEMREFFLGLMERFDLSYRTLENRDISLVPGLLKHEAPPFEERWESVGGDGCREIRMSFKLGSSMPAGIPAWFIARSNRFSLRLHWRLGALLADNPRDPRHFGLVTVSPDPVQPLVTLTVRGPHPHYLFGLLRDGLEVTFARYPGLRIERLIPCPGHDGERCAHEFHFRHLEQALDHSTYEIQCLESFKRVSIPLLLFGISWRADDQVVRRLDEIQSDVSLTYRTTRESAYMLSDALEELKDLRSLVQREFLRALRRDQQFEDSHCPPVFAVRPVGSRGWAARLTGQEILELQLYCCAPGEWHPVSDRGVYEITMHPELLNVLAPYVRGLVGALKYAVPLVGPLLGVASPAVIQAMDADIELMKALVEKLPDMAGRGQQGPLESSGVRHARGEALRALRRILDELDPQHEWGGLEKILTSEGDYLWLCDQHRKQAR